MNNFANDICTIMKALLPGVDFSTIFTNSYERFIIIEAPEARVEIFSKNVGSPLSPEWNAPKAKVNARQSLEGMSLEEIKGFQRVVDATAQLLDYWLRELK